MAAPVTYAEWGRLLDHFGEGDDTALEELSKGSFVVDAGTAARFYTRVENAYRKRKQTWLDKFQRSFQYFKTLDDVEMALRNGKQNLSPLHRLVVLKALPDDLRQTLQKDLEDFVAGIKNSLKDNVSKMSNGREKMLLLLNNFRLTDIPGETEYGTRNNQQNSNHTTVPTDRKIIFRNGK